MQGKLYGVGVGPGNPDLLTIAAIKCMQASEIIAVPASGGKEQVALEIAREYIVGKEVVSLDMPMTRDTKRMAGSHQEAAGVICSHLTAGRTVAFLTLGDPSIYSTYLYLHRLVLNAGFQAEIIPGIPSFCSAAAKINEGLCIGNENLHIIAGSHDDGEEALELSGTKVFMKAGRNNRGLIRLINEKGLGDDAALVERCDMPGQRVVKGLTEDTGDSSYFTLIIVKDQMSHNNTCQAIEPKAGHSHYPLFVDMEGRRVTVVGGGRIAAKRVDKLLRFGADITVVAPVMTKALAQYAEAGKLCWRAKEYEPADLKGASLVLAATDDRKLNQEIAINGQEIGTLVNVCDNKDEGDFWFSALVETGDLTAGIVSASGNHKKVAEFAEKFRNLAEETE